MRDIIGYTLTVNRGHKAGKVQTIMFACGADTASNKARTTRMRRRADRYDMEHGAICCSVVPVFGPEYDPAPAFRCTGPGIVADHVAYMAACGVAV